MFPLERNLALLRYIKEKYGPELEKILADRSNGFPAPSTQKASTLAT